MHAYSWHENKYGAYLVTVDIKLSNDSKCVHIYLCLQFTYKHQINISKCALNLFNVNC